MEFNHLSFYVDAVAPWRDWFVQAWGAVALGPCPDPAGDRLVVYVGQVPIVLVAQTAATQGYLGQHPPGIGDVALRVSDLAAALERVAAGGGKILVPARADPWGRGRWGQIQGWGALRHTLIESWQETPWVPEFAPAPAPTGDARPGLAIDAIDHAVLNVPAGDLPRAVALYSQQLGFQPRQRFAIDTARSGLRSLVLAHPQGGARLPINEPATENSQVQEFLRYNRGCGIQHVALHTENILQTVEQLKAGGVCFLPVPASYYTTLGDRPGYLPSDEADIARLQILVDWEPHCPQARLLQTFTQPLLDIPTVFFELIQRQEAWADNQQQRPQGFGERNFQALFEAIEREQMKRGSLA
jgi:4-hydroxyphenylpyruvate dioxygenase